MRPDDQRALGKGNGNAFVSTVGLWEASDGIHLRIDMTPAGADPTVTNRPGSVRSHRILFWDLREMLMANGCWVLGDEGADAQASGSSED
jgi:hypothetical protein